MTRKDEFEDSYFILLHDAQSWVQQAERHFISSKVIYKELTKRIRKERDIHDRLKEEFIGLMDSYFLLISLAFENLIKGLIISKKPDFNSTSELKPYKWESSGGHGIVEMINLNYKRTEESENILLEKLQTFLIWAGKYRIPKSPEKYINSKIPKIQHSIKSDDHIIAERLFLRIKEQIEINWKQNQSLFYKWVDEYNERKYKNK
ncbi:MAG: hypothetical protein U0W24_04985 [Bacteroidales bacterium]